MSMLSKKEYNKLYRATHQEYFRRIGKEYRNRNKEYFKEYNKKYYKANRLQLLAVQKERIEKFTDTQREAVRKYYAKYRATHKKAVHLLIYLNQMSN